MPLRVGFDMDGVIADFAAEYHAIEQRLFPAEPAPENPEAPEEAAAPAPGDEPRLDSRPAAVAARSKRVWREIQQTPDFWTTLKETETGVVKRIHEMTLRLRWETFFITQRPATAGDTVQRQTQRWLAAHGFDLPSVLVVPGSRGAAANALTLDYHVDDRSANCVDIRAEAKTRVILIVADDDLVGITAARRLGIGTAATVGAALDLLERASAAESRPTLFKQLAQLVGWD